MYSYEKAITYLFTLGLLAITPLIPLQVLANDGEQMQEDLDEAPYEQYVDEIIEKFAKKAKKKLRLICVGSGGSMPYNVASISVMFECYQKSTIEDARNLEVRATEMLITMVNENKKIRPYLQKYPFPPEAVCVSISFRKPNGKEITDGSVALVFQAKNSVFYDAADKKTDSYKNIAKEPYAEARAKVLGKTESDKDNVTPQ